MILIMNLIKSVQSIWSKLFTQHLLVTNTMSCASLFATGDFIQQTVELRRKLHPTGKRDWKRTRKFFFIGLMLGPCLHYYYIWLDKVHLLYFLFKK